MAPSVEQSTSSWAADDVGAAADLLNHTRAVKAVERGIRSPAVTDGRVVSHELSRPCETLFP